MRCGANEVRRENKKPKRETPSVNADGNGDEEKDRLGEFLSVPNSECIPSRKKA